MNVQVRQDNTNYPFILSGAPVYKMGTVAQIDPRTGDMERHTLMAYNPTSADWHPFTDETATDGTQYPKGILLASLTEAELEAGDVDDVPILVGGNVLIDNDQLVIENSKTLATIVNVPANYNTSVEDLLRMIGIYVQATIEIDGLENS